MSWISVAQRCAVLRRPLYWLLCAAGLLIEILATKLPIAPSGWTILLFGRGIWLVVAEYWAREVAESILNSPKSMLNRIRRKIILIEDDEDDKDDEGLDEPFPELLPMTQHVAAVFDLTTELSNRQSRIKELENEIRRLRSIQRQQDARIEDLLWEMDSRWTKDSGEFLMKRRKWEVRGWIKEFSDGHRIWIYGPGPGTNSFMPIKDIDQYRCPICIAFYDEGDDTVMLPCGHRFHEDCVSPWLQRNSSCPRCTRKIGWRPVLMEGY